MVKYKLAMYFRDLPLAYNSIPKYLGITLNRLLTYENNFLKTSAKIKTRNNIILKLARSSWESSSETLRISLALFYSAAKTL